MPNRRREWIMRFHEQEWARAQNFLLMQYVQLPQTMSPSLYPMSHSGRKLSASWGRLVSSPSFPKNIYEEVPKRLDGPNRSAPFLEEYSLAGLFLLIPPIQQYSPQKGACTQFKAMFLKCNGTSSLWEMSWGLLVLFPNSILFPAVGELVHQSLAPLEHMPTKSRAGMFAF